MTADDFTNDSSFEVGKPCTDPAGYVTAANNGGFAQVRSDSWGGYMAFNRSRGVRMVVQGDGRIYKLSAYSSFNGVMYQV